MTEERELSPKRGAGDGLGWRRSQETEPTLAAMLGWGSREGWPSSGHRKTWAQRAAHRHSSLSDRDSGSGRHNVSWDMICVSFSLRRAQGTWRGILEKGLGREGHDVLIAKGSE